jgi:Divergent InlB B-repeat domain
MYTTKFQKRSLWSRLFLASAASALALLAAPLSAYAQSAIIYGSLSNFDIANDTGETCHGFEVEMENVTAAQVPYSFSSNRYGAPVVIPTDTGVRVRWESPYNPNNQQFVTRTLPHTVSWFPGQCYQWVPSTYEDGGCEHFGTYTTANPTRVTSRWLCKDPENPAVLVPNDPPTAVPYASYYVQQPVQPNNPPVLVAEVEAPEPPDAPELYGEAQWMRVYEVQLQRQLNLNELVADNPNVVPMNLAQLESDWEIVQAEPASGGDGTRGRHRNEGNIESTTQSVVRRIELYTYTGQYDPVTNEALCADGLCAAPGADEMGELISVQMTAANVQPDAVVVTKTGSGRIQSADKFIDCGNKCAQPYNAGALVTLTVKPDSGNVFSGWSGACAGTQTTCTVAANGIVRVGATFTVQSSGGGGGGGGTSTTYTLSIIRDNPGTVTGTPAGVDTTINCGSVCAAKFTSGTAVTLTATPPAGKRFEKWNGDCSGTATTCRVTINKTTSVKAIFSK